MTIASSLILNAVPMTVKTVTALPILKTVTIDAENNIIVTIDVEAITRFSHYLNRDVSFMVDYRGFDLGDDDCRFLGKSVEYFRINELFDANYCSEHPEYDKKAEIEDLESVIYSNTKWLNKVTVPLIKTLSNLINEDARTPEDFKKNKAVIEALRAMTYRVEEA